MPLGCPGFCAGTQQPRAPGSLSRNLWGKSGPCLLFPVSSFSLSSHPSFWKSGDTTWDPGVQVRSLGSLDPPAWGDQGAPTHGCWCQAWGALQRGRGGVLADRHIGCPPGEAPGVWQRAGSGGAPLLLERLPLLHPGTLPAPEGPSVCHCSPSQPSSPCLLSSISSQTRVEIAPLTM